MGEIVNLRRARKNKARAVKISEAAANRAKFGASRSERDVAASVRALDDARLEAHKRVCSETSPDDHAD